MNDSASVTISHVDVTYGDSRAVSDVDLRIEPGSFFTLLGPSGCGKTTLLRTIAGFITQSAGEIRVGDSRIDHLPPHKRDTGMVFQNYAIFPHLNVYENIAYGLKARNVTGAEKARRIEQALEMVDLDGYEKRLPRALSGGQQQRVVIARALAIRPRVLLMDEPLANLDAKLRVRLRNDIRKLQQELGITTVYVTHDQDEALSLSDRIAVMSHGLVEQVGTPTEIYERPVSLNVAEFIGTGNFRKARLAPGPRPCAVFEDGQSLELDGGSAAQALAGEVWVGFRPHLARLADPATAVMRGELERVEYLGAYQNVFVRMAGGISIVQRPATERLSARPGDLVGLDVAPKHVMVFRGDDKVDGDE